MGGVAELLSILRRNKTMDLREKRIIVTGASRGLGLLCAQAMAKQGARLVLIARSQDKLDEAKDSLRSSRKHLVIAADLTNMEELQNAIKKAKDFLGDVDVVLHAAGGGLGFREPLIQPQELDMLYKLNVGAAVEINRIVVPDMIKKGSGNIVHIGSSASNEAIGSVGYNTVKAALAGYVRSIGREMANTGVIITAALPGAFSAPENSWMRLAKEKPDVVDKFVKEKLPRGRLGLGEEIVPLILLLCSSEASMMPGCCVPIDAGESRSFERLD